jgi:hypothetical protein
MLLAAFAAELPCIEMRRKLRVIGIAVGLNHPYHPFVYGLTFRFLLCYNNPIVQQRRCGFIP